jgi:alanine-glyoxylate transaminase/serine-glyoxylate transaminase/serine-pyruvate transaminase
MLFEEGLPSVYARHRRLAGAVRAAVRAWGLEVYCLEEDAASDTLTGVVTPEGVDSGTVIVKARERFGLSLGVGLGTVKGKLFRIGHLGSLNELEVLATAAGVEMALAEAGVRVRLGSGVEAAEERLLARERVPR